ncbi:hypothetical protein PMALA_068560 [Plasmodium malariae]|uniref:PIR Superfamily Protein n=1 Tax=Plasmodium malariae TaxID=5858 RepID=A0A1A8X503_PLAMA|nr:hypothetical protein PMALA_068560 [Plasmodium malariae]
MTQEFRKISKHIINKTSSLINKTNKKTFRKECLELVDFLIQNKKAPFYENQNKWGETIKFWATSHYKRLAEKHGGCFPIFDDKEKKILELNYEALDFCDEKNNKINEIQCHTGVRKISSECDETCSSKIDEYNAWIKEKRKHFSTQKVLIQNNCKNPQSQFPTRKCDILNPITFRELPKCRVRHAVARTQPESAEKKTIPPDADQTTDSVQSNLQDSQKQDSQLLSGEQEKIKVKTEQEEVRSDLQSQTDELSSTKVTSTQGDVRNKKDPPLKKEQTSATSKNEEEISSDGSTFSSKPEESVDLLRFETTPSSISASIPVPPSLTPSAYNIFSGNTIAIYLVTLKINT